MEYPMPRGARLPLTPHLLELRELAGRSFVTLGNLDECPRAQETALLADVLIALVEMHGAWSGGRATVEVLATVPCHLATTAPLVQYEQGSSSGRAGLVRVTDRTELAACLSKSWATIRPLVLCAHDASRIRTEDLEQLEGPRETPRGTLAEERDAQRVVTLCQLGRRGDAAASYTRFSSSYPGSIHRARLDRTCAVTP